MNTKTFLLIICFLFSIGLSAQGQETGEVRQITDFKAISAACAIHVVLQKGNSPSVKIVSAGIDLTDIITEVEGDKLKIYRESCVNGDESGKKKKKKQRGSVKAFVTYTQLKSLKASSAATIDGEELKAPTLEISVSSAANVNITNVETAALSLSVSSGAQVEISGKSDKTTFDASSGAKVKTLNLTSKSAKISASSGANISLTVVNELKATAGSGAKVRYKGNPAKNISDVSSGGSVKGLETGDN